MAIPPKSFAKPPEINAGNGHSLAAGKVRFLHFSELLKRPVCAGSIRDRIGKLTDLVWDPERGLVAPC